MTIAPVFQQSFAIFDAEQRLVDWNAGFVQEFSDASALLVRGVSAADIYAACLLPERALDFSWMLADEPPPAFEYINRRHSIVVMQERSHNGNILRLAQYRSAAPELHRSMQDGAAELLRTTALKLSAALVKQRAQENLRLNTLARVDGLTSVANRRYFDEVYAREWQRCKFRQLPLSVIFIDVDFFKSYNDWYGHAKGDECLQTIAATLEKNLNRPGDLVARYGGEEFTCLIPESDLQGATSLAKKLEEAVRALAIPHEKSTISSTVTISLGVACASQVLGLDPSALLKAADQLLYRAKNEGRGCVRAERVVV